MGSRLCRPQTFAHFATAEEGVGCVHVRAPVPRGPDNIHVTQSCCVLCGLLGMGERSVRTQVVAEVPTDHVAHDTSES